MKHLKKLTEATLTSGLGVFLVIGLQGCDSENVCNKNMNNLTQKQQLTQKECKDNNSAVIVPSSSGYTHSSGFFSPSSTYHSSSSSGG
jgi:hypothetical protein